jgi:hypothetical protein
VRTVNDHSNPVHLANNFAPEISQSAIFFMTPASGKIISVIGKQHLPYTEPIIEINHPGITVKRIHALNVKSYGESAFASGTPDVIDGLDLDHLLTVGPNPMTIS